MLDFHHRFVLQPFWPLGTGVAHGFLGVFDAAWMLRLWGLGQRTPLQLIVEREATYRTLGSINPEHLCKNAPNYSIDPMTRYLQIDFSKAKVRTGDPKTKIKLWMIFNPVKMIFLCNGYNFFPILHVKQRVESFSLGKKYFDSTLEVFLFLLGSFFFIRVGESSGLKNSFLQVFLVRHLFETDSRDVDKSELPDAVQMRRPVTGLTPKRPRRDTVCEDVLFQWCRNQLQPYGLTIPSMGGFWAEPMPLCALIHHFRPELM